MRQNVVEHQQNVYLVRQNYQNSAWFSASLWDE